jgi:hypothetical protein
MNELQQTMVLGAIFPAAIKNNAAFTSQVIDAADADYVEWHAMVGATDIAMAAFKVMESDTKTDATTLGGTPAQVHDVAVKPGADDDNKVWIIGVTCRSPRKRYLQLQATAGNGTAGTYLAASAVIRKSGVRSSLAADRGAAVAEYA